jgi:hypothetical protein
LRVTPWKLRTTDRHAFVMRQQRDMKFSLHQNNRTRYESERQLLANEGVTQCHLSGSRRHPVCLAR